MQPVQFDPRSLPGKDALEAFFFEAMNRVGYTSPTPTIENHPIIKGWKRVIYRKILGDYTLQFIDSWGPGVGNTSIEIYTQDTPLDRLLLWVMVYEGTYEKEALPYLKEALASTYTKEEFCGGRGPAEWRHANSRADYQNKWTGTFQKFKGEERVRIPSGRLWIPRGRHGFWGGVCATKPSSSHTS